MRPLLIAEACNPEWTSIPLEGWSHARAIQSLTGGLIVTQIRNREAVLRAGLIEGLDFTAIDSEAVAARAYKLASFLRGGEGKGWTTATFMSGLVYPTFEKLVWKVFGERIAAKEFDVVHRVTPTSPTVAGPLAARCKSVGVPMVIGPLNGGLPWPAGFDAERRQEREWLSYVRGAYRMMPRFAAMRRDAAAIICGSVHAYRQEPAEVREKCFYIAENGIDPVRFRLFRQRDARRPIRAVFVGRLVPYKGADMLLEAAAPLIRAGELTIELIGDGPMKDQLREMIERENIASGVSLIGWIDHRELNSRLAEADVLAFPSIREFGGAVVLEAMACGVVPIVVNYGGPGELATERTGYLIPLGNRSEIVAQLRDVLAKLATNPAEIDAKSPLARWRAMEEFTWDHKAKQVMRVYEWVCRPGTGKPEFYMPAAGEREAKQK